MGGTVSYAEKFAAKYLESGRGGQGLIILKLADGIGSD